MNLDTEVQYSVLVWEKIPAISTHFVSKVWDQQCHSGVPGSEDCRFIMDDLPQLPIDY